MTAPGPVREPWSRGGFLAERGEETTEQEAQPRAQKEEEGEEEAAEGEEGLLCGMGGSREEIGVTQKGWEP